MARKKYSTALFDVISRSKSEPVEPVAPAPKSERGWFSWRREKSDFAEPPMSAMRDMAPPAPAMMELAPAPMSKSSMMSSDDEGPIIGFDSQRKEMTFKLSYAGAAVWTFMLMIALIGAFVMGQRTNRQAMPMLSAMTTEELKNLPPQPEVLEVGRSPANEASTVEVKFQAPPEPKRENQTWNEPKPPNTLVVKDRARQIGLNYVVAQSYPKEEEAMARSAREILAKAGIDCTVEQGVPGWKADWFCVMGTTGFDKIRNSPEFDSYVRSIMNVSNRMAGSAKFKQFRPTAVRWKGNSN